MDHLVDAADGVRVCFLDAVVQAGVADHLDVVTQMVEDQHRFREHEDRLRDALGVGRHGRHPRLEVPDGVVGQVANGPAVEHGQTADRDEFVLAHFLLDQCQGVHLALWLASTGMEHAVGVGADEAVAAQPLPAFNAFQQKGVGRAGYLEVSRDRGLQVGVNGAIDGHQVALSRQGSDLVQSWVVHRAAFPVLTIALPGAAGEVQGWGTIKKTRPPRDGPHPCCHPSCRPHSNGVDGAWPISLPAGGVLPTFPLCRGPLTGPNRPGLAP